MLTRIRVGFCALLALCGPVQAQREPQGSDAYTLRQAKLILWERGLECAGCDDTSTLRKAAWASRSLPVLPLRGGCSDDTCAPETPNLEALKAELGPEFTQALRENERQHVTKCICPCMQTR